MCDRADAHPLRRDVLGQVAKAIGPLHAQIRPAVATSCRALWIRRHGRPAGVGNKGGGWRVAAAPTAGRTGVPKGEVGCFPIVEEKPDVGGDGGVPPVSRW
jgi:hypothetical protein